jgi:hypothetical protein
MSASHGPTIRWRGREWLFKVELSRSARGPPKGSYRRMGDRRRADGDGPVSILSRTF